MPEESDSKAAEAAEKAYAAAAEKLKADESSSGAAAPVPATPEPPAPVADAKPAAPVTVVAAEPSPISKAPVGKPGPKPTVAKKVAPKPAIKPAAKKVAKPKPVVPAVKAAPVASASASKGIAKKAPIRKLKSAGPKSLGKPKSIPAPTSTQEPSITQLKERIIMATAKKSPDLKTKVSATVADAKAKAKALYGTAYAKGAAAYTKGSVVLGEVGEFSKGNVEAVVSSGKILSSGVKTLGRDYVEDSKTAFETMTSDLKKLAAIKTPTELFQLQGELLRRNFDTAVAYGSKNSEKVVKLANEVFAPISNRVSLAVDKVSKAA